MKIKYLFVFSAFLILFVPAAETGVEFQAGDVSNKELLKIFKEAEYSFQQGDYERALSEFCRTTFLAQGRRFRQIELASLRSEALTLWNLGRVSDSSVLFERIAKMDYGNDEIEIRNFSRAALKIISLYLEAKEERKKAHYSKSLDRFHQAIVLSDQLGCDHLKLKCLRQISLVLIDLGKNREFSELVKVILRISEQTNNHRELSYSLINYGQFFVSNNAYIKALSCFQRSYEIAVRLGEVAIQADCLNNIGVCYQYLGDYDKAISNVKKAILLINDPSNSTQIIDYLINLGAAIARNAERRGSDKDYFAASEYLNRGLKLANINKLRMSEVNALINLGFLNELKGSDENALKYYSEGYRIELVKPAFEQKTILLCNLGNIKRKLNETGSALLYYEKAEKIALSHSFNHILWEIYLGQGLCYQKSGRIKDSIACMKKSIAIIEFIKITNAMSSKSLLNIDDKKQVYSELIETLMGSKKKKSSDCNIDEIVDLMEMANSGYHRDQIRLSEDDNSINNVIKTSGMGPEVSAATQIKNQLLDNKTAVIEYSVGKRASFMVCIRKGGSDIHRIAGADQIGDSINGYLRAIGMPEKRYAWQKAAERISLELIPNIENIWKSGIRHLIIIPDNILYLLPYEALRHNNKYLVERFSISYSSSSLSLIKILKENIWNKSKSYLGIGAERYNATRSKKHMLISRSPIESSAGYYNEIADKYPRLAYCQDEIRDTYELFPTNNADILLGLDATEAGVKNKANNKYKVIHFACHGITGVEDPLNSALVLLEDTLRSEDGFLQAKEIVNMRILADLVLISSCESGIETGNIGFGIMGISKAFINSGARSVIATLWKINDRTTTFIVKHLFEKLLAGYSKNEALRYAKLAMIESKYSHPYYWAAFILNGEYDSRPFEASSWQYGKR